MKSEKERKGKGMLLDVFRQVSIKLPSYWKLFY